MTIDAINTVIYFIKSKILNIQFSSIYEDYLRKNTDNSFWLVNTNKLVRFKKGVDGLKTGYTSGAGYCLTATMMKDDMRVIATVMGEPSSQTRNNEVSSMLDYAFAQMGLKKLLSKNSVIETINLPKAKLDEAKIVPSEDVNLLYKKIDGEITPTYEIDINEIKVPTKKGDVVGTLYVKNEDKIINEIDLTVYGNTLLKALRNLQKNRHFCQVKKKVPVAVFHRRMVRSGSLHDARYL